MAVVWNNYRSPAYINRMGADWDRINNGTLLQRLAGAAGKAAQRIPGVRNIDLGVSEMFGTPTALAANPELAAQEEYNNQLDFQKSVGAGVDPFGGQPLTSRQSTWGQLTAGGAGGGTGTEYVPNLAETYPGSGQFFDLNDPTQREQYFAARQQYALGQVGEYQTRQQRNLNLAIQQAKNEADTYRRQYQTAQDQENINWDQYLKDFAYGQQQLDTQYGQGEAARMGKYTALSPNAYQSSMGTSGQYALNQLQTGKKRQEEKKATEQAQKTSRETQRQADIKALNDYYNLYEQQQRQAFDDAVNAFREQIMAQASQEAGTFGTADMQAGLGFNPAKYSYNQLSEWKPTQADTSDLIPDISFGTSGAKTSGTNMLTQAAQSMTTPKVASIPALDTYQGMTATSKEKDPLQTWLY